MNSRKPNRRNLLVEPDVYRLVPVATRRQRWAFIGMQMTFLVILLWFSVRILTLFFSPLVGSTTVSVILWFYGAGTVFWQSLYVRRILAMKRAVLVDPSVPGELRLAMATTIVPSREFALLRDKLRGMAAVDPCGNRLDCWVLDEEDDPRVKAMVEEFDRRYGKQGLRFLHFTRKGFLHYNEPPCGRRFTRFQRRQKGGNINAWLDAMSPLAYDVVTFLDLDHVPQADFYRKVLPYFRDSAVAFVQGPESFRNRNENFITRAASHERDTFFGLVHRSYFGLGMPVIVGSHTTFRADALRAVGGYYPVHLTEDYLIMLKLRAMRLRGVFVDEVLAVGELPSTWSAYLGQQYRWASGGLDLLFRYLPKFWRRYDGKERLYYLTLLNYYAWGAFFVFSKGLLYSLLIAGLVVHLESELILAIVGFTIVVAIANHVWERQFFVEKGLRSYLLENALMNNFLGCLYGMALVKAIVAPNTPFAVTAKSGVDHRGAAVPYLMVSLFLLVAELGALAIAEVGRLEGAVSLPETGNLFLYPLLVSVVGNALMVLLFRRMERPRPCVEEDSQFLVAGDTAGCSGHLADLGG